MKIKESFSRKVFVVLNTIFMLFICFIMLYPMLYIVFASLSDSGMLMRNNGLLFWPMGFNLASYEAVFQNPNILNGFKNTIIILISSLSLQMFLTLLAGYVLSRKGLMLNRFFTLMMTFTMFFSGGIIPSYLIVKGLGMLDTYWAIIIPGAVSVTNVIIMRTGFMGVPDSLSASAVGLPILLVNTKVTSQQLTYLTTLKSKKIHIVGGESAVSNSVETTLKGKGYTVTRYAGKNRYETSEMVAKAFFPNATNITLAYGQNFPDGLSGAPLASALNAPLLLAESSKTSNANAYAKESGAKRAVVFGGTKLISNSAAKQILKH